MFHSIIFTRRLGTLTPKKAPRIITQSTFSESKFQFSLPFPRERDCHLVPRLRSRDVLCKNPRVTYMRIYSKERAFQPRAPRLTPRKSRERCKNPAPQKPKPPSPAPILKRISFNKAPDGASQRGRGDSSRRCR